jgi:hypothetical protein
MINYTPIQAMLDTLKNHPAYNHQDLEVNLIRGQYRETYKLGYDVVMYAIYQSIEDVIQDDVEINFSNMILKESIKLAPEKIRKELGNNVSDCIKILEIDVKGKIVGVGEDRKIRDIEPVKSNINPEGDFNYKEVSEYIKTLFKCEKFGIITVIQYNGGSYEGAHRNIIFAVVNKKSKTITLNYYEPHGSNTNSLTKTRGVDTFFKNLEKNTKDYTLKFNYETVSCPIGIQTKLRGIDSSYCVMHSYLWIYMVYSVLFFNSADGWMTQSKGWLQKIESWKDNYSPKEIYRIVVTFAFYMCEKYWSSMKDLNPVIYNEIGSKFDKFLYEEIKDQKIKPIKKVKVSAQITKTKKAVEKLAKEKGRKKAEYEDEFEKEWKGYEHTNMGEECKENKECDSGCCKDNVCNFKEECEKMEE